MQTVQAMRAAVAVILGGVLLLAGCEKSESSCQRAVRSFAKQLDEVRALKGEPPAGEQEQKMERKFYAALGGSCEAQRWSGEAVRCLGEATTSAAFDECEAMLSEEQREQLGEAMAKAAGLGYFVTTKAKRAQVMAKKLAFEAYPQWAMAHPDKECPNKIEELYEYVNEPNVQDPWGRPFFMLCGRSAPPEVRGLAISSDGEDGKRGSEDDLKSWEPR